MEGIAIKKRTLLSRIKQLEKQILKLTHNDNWSVAGQSITPLNIVMFRVRALDKPRPIQKSHFVSSL